MPAMIPGKAAADRIAADPRLPVPQTTTCLIGLTLTSVLGPLVADITIGRNGSSEAITTGLARPDQPPGWLASTNLLDTTLRSSYQPV